MSHDGSPRPTQNVAARVKELRKRQGWAAAQLAERMEAAGLPWDRFTVQNLENGRRQNLSADELVALAEVLDVSPVTLLLPPDPPSADQGPAWEARWVWMHGEHPLFTPRGTDDPRGDPDWHDRMRRFRTENRPYEGPNPMDAITRFVRTLVPGRRYKLELSSDGDQTTGSFTDLGPHDGER